jgi:hypothetical protein
MAVADEPEHLARREERIGDFCRGDKQKYYKIGVSSPSLCCVAAETSLRWLRQLVRRGNLVRSLVLEGPRNLRLQLDDALPLRHFPFNAAAAAYGWLDAHPDEAIKVALTYDGTSPE